VDARPVDPSAVGAGAAVLAVKATKTVRAARAAKAAEKAAERRGTSRWDREARSDPPSPRTKGEPPGSEGSGTRNMDDYTEAVTGVYDDVGSYADDIFEATKSIRGPAPTKSVPSVGQPCGPVFKPAAPPHWGSAGGFEFMGGPVAIITVVVVGRAAQSQPTKCLGRRVCAEDGGWAGAPRRVGRTSRCVPW
jgi:hypothetical protein